MPKTTKKKNKTASRTTKKKSNNTPSSTSSKKNTIPVFPSTIQLEENSPYVEFQLSEAVSPKRIRLHVRAMVKDKFKTEFLAKIDAGDATGKTCDGETFSISNLGNWMFGVIGYKSNLKITNIGKLGCRIYYSDKMPKEAKDFLEKVKKYFHKLSVSAEATVGTSEHDCSNADRTTPVFPSELPASYDSPKMQFDLPVHVGDTEICVYLRELAKDKFRDKYFTAIDTQGTVGTNRDGVQIPIHNVGRWLFGVSGYKMNVIIRNKQGVGCRIHYHSDIPKAALELLQDLKNHFHSLEKSISKN